MNRKDTYGGKVTRSKPQTIILDVFGPFAMKQYHILSNEKKQFYKKHIQEYVNSDEAWQRGLGGQLKLFYPFAHLMQQSRKLLPNEPKIIAPLKDISNIRNSEPHKESLVKYILFGMENNPTDAQLGYFLETLQGWGYKRGLLKTPVYDDVPTSLRRWRDVQNIQVLLHLGDKKVFERIVASTNKGNLRQYFSGNCRPDYSKTGLEAFSKCKLVFPIKDIKNVLFVTHSAREAAGAKHSGIPVVLIIRPDLDTDFDKRMNEEKKNFKPDKDGVGGAGSNIESFDTGPLTEVASSALKSHLEAAGASKIEIKDIESKIKESSREAHEEVSSAIKYQDTQNFEVIRSLNDLFFK